MGTTELMLLIQLVKILLKWLLSMDAEKREKKIVAIEKAVKEVVAA